MVQDVRIVVTTCANCIHWKQAGHYFPGEGTCQLMGSMDGEPTTPATLAYGGDVERYGAFVTTKENFGCVMGETG